MISSDNPFTVLCFGDSNTWGQKPDSENRLSSTKRWPTITQMLLGDKFSIIEDGKCSRTTNLTNKHIGLNGKLDLKPSLQSHNPVDLVLVMLGTNDLKIEYNRSVTAVGQALADIVDAINLFGKNAPGQSPMIVLVCPVPLYNKAPLFKSMYTKDFDAHSIAKSAQLEDELQSVAANKKCFFLKASSVAQVGEDGVHLSINSHQAMAERMVNVIRTLAQDPTCN